MDQVATMRVWVRDGYGNAYDMPGGTRAVRAPRLLDPDAANVYAAEAHARPHGTDSLDITYRDPLGRPVHERRILGTLADLTPGDRAFLRTADGRFILADVI